MSGTALKQQRLRLKMARRGLQAVDLARLAGLSPATMTAALHGRSVSTTTLFKIATALTRAPVVPVVEDLIEIDGMERGFQRG
jgi:transcriptional regulator with XRE-family HTH domain